MIKVFYVMSGIVSTLSRIALGFCVTVFGAYADEPERLTIYTEQFPPYNFAREDAIVGINVEILQAACQQSGITCEFELLSWNRAMKMAQQDPAGGIASTSRLPSREPLFQWVGPLVSGNSCLFKLASREDITVKRRKDLQAFTIDVQPGDVYEVTFANWGLDPERNYLRFANKGEAFAALIRGELDLLIASEITIRGHLQRYEMPISSVQPVYHVKDKRLRGNYLALNKQVPEHWVQTLQQQLDVLRKSGEYQRIKATYLYQGEFDRTTLSRSVRACL